MLVRLFTVIIVNDLLTFLLSVNPKLIKVKSINNFISGRSLLNQISLSTCHNSPIHQIQEKGRIVFNYLRFGFEFVERDKRGLEIIITLYKATEKNMIEEILSSTEMLILIFVFLGLVFAAAIATRIW